jgi:hypothetical protein
VHDANFKDVLLHCKYGKTWNKFIFSDGFEFQANKLCIPASSIRLLLLQEGHGGGLMGHFGVKKMEDILAAHFGVNENAYKLDLPADFGVSPIFNIADLKPYLGEEDELESRRFKCKNERMMWTSTPVIHPHLHIIRFLAN